MKGFYGCSFVGYQDTVLTDTGTQYFGHSYIEGAVGGFHIVILLQRCTSRLIRLTKYIFTDFIFGQTAKTYIKSSVIASVAAGAITASGPPSYGEGICKALTSLALRS